MTAATKQFDYLIDTLSSDDLEIIAGNGATVTAADGKKYVDCTTGQGVALMGHGNELIAGAVAKAWENFAFISPKHPHVVRAEFLEKLASRMPAGVTKFFLSSSGTEANEAALKFARLATGRTQFLAAKRAFHGRTMGSLSVTFKPDFRAPFEPLIPDCDFFAFDKAESLAEKISDKTAAVILEVIQGESGIYVGSQQFFDEVRALCDKTGALLIIDEVQSGAGRTGKFLALEHFNIRPDIVTMSKALGGGYPLAATAVRQDLFANLPAGKAVRGSHNSTFGANVPACAAGLAVLNFLTPEILENATLRGAELVAGIKAINSPKIKEVRGIGLMLAVEFADPAAPIVQKLRDNGVLVLPTGPKAIRLLPPIVITAEECNMIVQSLGKALV